MSQFYDLVITIIANAAGSVLSAAVLGVLATLYAHHKAGRRSALLVVLISLAIIGAILALRYFRISLVAAGVVAVSIVITVTSAAGAFSIKKASSRHGQAEKYQLFGLSKMVHRDSLAVFGKHNWKFPRLRKLALVGLLITPLIGYWVTGKVLSLPKQTVVLVANFDGPDPEKYGVTDAVLNNLRLALQPYSNIRVKPLGRVITESDGSEVARQLGSWYEASIVIWGWYKAPGDVVPISVHFETIDPVNNLPQLGPSAQGRIQLLGLSDLKSFSLQTEVSKEMSYLTLFTLGYTQEVADSHALAIKFFTQAVALAPTNYDALDIYVVYRFRAYAYMNSRDPKSALADFNRVLSLQPDMAITYNDRAVAYADLDDRANAIASLDQAIKLDPNLSIAFQSRGTIHAMNGEFTSAISDLDRAIELDANDARNYYDRSAVYENMSQLDLALADVNKALQLDPNMSEAYNERALVYMYRYDYQRALVDLDHAIALVPIAGPYYLNRAAAKLGLHETDNAIKDLSKCIELQPDISEAYLRRGELYQSTGDALKAIADFRKVISLNDNATFVQEANTKLAELGVKAP